MNCKCTGIKICQSKEKACMDCVYHVSRITLDGQGLFCHKHEIEPVTACEDFFPRVTGEGNNFKKKVKKVKRQSNENGDGFIGLVLILFLLAMLVVDLLKQIGILP